MIEPPRITQTVAKLSAILPVVVPRAEMHKVMGPGLREVLAAIAAQGIAPAGPWFTHHLKITPDAFDFEICVPVTTQFTAAGRVVPSAWPALRVAQTVYHGPYEGLGAAWGELEGWIAKSGHTSAADLWECYVTGPESTPDPTAWRTELNRPLVE